MQLKLLFSRKNSTLKERKIIFCWINMLTLTVNMLTLTVNSVVQEIRLFSVGMIWPEARGVLAKSLLLHRPSFLSFLTLAFYGLNVQNTVALVSLIILQPVVPDTLCEKQCVSIACNATGFVALHICTVVQRNIFCEKSSVAVAA